MVLTELDFPILQQFFCSVERRTGMPAQPLEATPEQRQRAEQQDEDHKPKQLPKGVVLGPDGKPYVLAIAPVSSYLAESISDAAPARPSLHGPL